MDNGNVVPLSFTTALRDAIPANKLQAGLVILNSSTGKINFYDGSAWVAVTSA